MTRVRDHPLVSTTMTYPLPLPPNPFPPSSCQKAYQIILELEARAPSLPNNPLVSARLLGHLLRLAPHEHARDQLEREINGASGDDALISLAGHYMQTFLRTCEFGNMV